jgi:mono/diheme cytochrome c family protein
MERWCISCHKATGPMADQPAPPLSVLAANADSSARAIRAFLMHPHPPMPPLELSNQMIEDIIAYLRQVASTEGAK